MLSAPPSQIRQLLRRGGATAWDQLEDASVPEHLPRSYRFDPAVVTHVIALSLHLPEYERCIDMQADCLQQDEAEFIKKQEQDARLAALAEGANGNGASAHVRRTTQIVTVSS